MPRLDQFIQGFQGDIPYLVLFAIALVAMVIWWVLRKQNLGRRQRAERTLEAFNLERMKRTGLIDEEELKKVRLGLAGVLQKELETSARGGSPTMTQGADLRTIATKLAVDLGDQYEKALAPLTEDEKRAQREAVARAEQEWRRSKGMAEKYLDPGLKPQTLDERMPAYSAAASDEAVPHTDEEDAGDTITGENDSAPAPLFDRSPSLADSGIGAVWGDLDTEAPPSAGAPVDARPNLEAMFEAGVIDAEEFKRLRVYYEERAKKG